MPAALPVDRAEVRTVAVQIGVREAARRFGLNEDTVKAWSMREGWFTAEEATERRIAAIRTEQRVERGLQPIAPTAASIMAEYSGNTRLNLAKGLHRGSEVVARMDGREILLAASNVATLAKAASIVHDWPKSVQLNVLSDVLSDPDQDISADVIDV